MKNLVEKLHKENADRWIGKASYDCLTCGHSMTTDENKLICVANSPHKKVDDNYLCEQWI